MRLLIALMVGCAFSTCASCAFSPAPSRELMTPRDVLAVPVQRADHVLKYGDAESQFGELRVPVGPGPHPVVVLVHGGCWRSIAGVSFMRAMADALKAEGVATWNIEYRRLPELGSGWPGTYLDTAQAIDHLRVLAPAYGLDLSRIVLLGHSAGGHLAHWAASRHRLPRDSELHNSDPLVPIGVINLAGRLDMATGIKDYERLCLGPVVRDLLGGTPATVGDRYRDVSPQRLLPLGVKQVLIWGEFEEFVPARLVRRYVSEALRRGDDAELVVLPSVGHFETASPTSIAWPAVRDAIHSLLEPTVSN